LILICVIEPGGKNPLHPSGSVLQPVFDSRGSGFLPYKSFLPIGQVPIQGLVFIISVFIVEYQMVDRDLVLICLLEQA